MMGTAETGSECLQTRRLLVWAFVNLVAKMMLQRKVEIVLSTRLDLC